MLHSFSEDDALTFLETIMEWLLLGGPVVALLIVMSVIAMAVTLLKIYQFARSGTVVPDAVSHAVDALHEQRFDDAERILRQDPGLAAEIVATIMAGMRGASFDAVAARENVTRLAADHLSALRQHFRTLEVIASLSPLLGLFGTVLGMIEAFRELEAAGSQVDPSLLSGGIWEALLTTAVGLAVAIPTVVVLNLLEQKVDHFAHRLDSLISRLFTGAAMIPGLSESVQHSPSNDSAQCLAATDSKKPSSNVDLQPAPLPGV